MSLTDYKITDSAIAQKGVIAAPDKLTGTAAQNKAVFDRLIRETVQELFNGLIDALSGEDGAAEIGTTAIAGIAGGDVQTVLRSLKTILDTKSTRADVTSALSLKSDKSVTDLHIKSVSFNAVTGAFTFTRQDGSFTVIDTALEKVATNWRYDALTQSLILTLADGSAQSIPLSAFVTETEFQDSDQIEFSVRNHCVTASIKTGSITDSMLSSALAAQLRGYVITASNSATSAAQSVTAAEVYKNTANQKAADAAASASNASNSASAAAQSATAASTSASSASTSETNAANSAASAENSAKDSEAWAVGQRSGADVPSTDAAYHNNAKYWAEQAEQSANARVTSFNGRTGAVTPQSGDYTAAMVGLGSVNNTSDLNKPVSTATQTALNAKQNKIKRVTVTLSASGWSSKTQSVTVTGVSATETAQLIQPVPASASRSAYEAAGVRATAQATNRLTFSCDSVPTSSLTVYVVITEVSA